MPEHLHAAPATPPAESAAAPPPGGVPRARFTPPRGSSRLIEREALQAQLLDARRLRCVTLTGPAGAGKSTTLAAWRRAVMPLGYDVAWLALTPEDDDLPRFLDGLLASIAQIDAGLAAPAALLAPGATDAEGVERLVITAVRAIAAHRREFVVVLDDLQHLTLQPIRDALQWLLDFAPPNLHLVLASRSPIPLSLERLRAQGQLREIDGARLRFSAAESAQFLRLQLGRIDARSVRQLHELTDGWVAGLQLLSIEWKKNPPQDLHAGAEASHRAPLRDARAFARFFGREVFAQLTPDEMTLLVALAPCSRFCASLCAALIEQPDRISDVAAVLARLEADNLFIATIDSTEADTWYRLNPLLRETLLARFAQADAQQQRAVHARAFGWFRERGALEDALLHALHAGDGAQAAALVEHCAHDLFARGERATLIALIRQLPPAEIAGRIHLRMWVMRAKLFLRDLDACALHIAELSRELGPDDAAAQFMLAVHTGSLAVQRDDTDAALALLPRLQDVPADAEAVALGGSLNIQSWLYMHRGDYALARRIQQEGAAPMLCTAAGSLYGRCLVGLSHALEGQMTQAERIYRAVLHEAGQHGKACADTTVLAGALLGDVLYEHNEAPEALRLLEERIDILERISIPDAVLRALRVLSSAHWLAGHHLEAFASLERLEDYATRHGLDRLLAHSLANQARRRMQLGQYMAAEACIARLDALDARHPDAAGSALREISELAQRVRIRWRVAQGDLDGAALALAPLLAHFEGCGRLRSAARLYLEGALIEARRGRAVSARAMALNALRLGHRLGLLRSLLDADDAALPLIREVTQGETLDPVLAFYVERLEAADQHHDARVRTASARARPANLLESFSGREVDMLRLVSQAMPNKKIARTLGLSPETVKWYLSRIYAKLQVGGRDEAVARVRDLGWGLQAPATGTTRSGW